MPHCPEEWESKLCQARWHYVFQQTKFEEQFLDLTFSIHNCALAYNANVECVFSLTNFQWTKEQNKLDVTTVDAMLQCIWDIDCKEFYRQIL